MTQPLDEIASCMTPGKATELMQGDRRIANDRTQVSEARDVG